MTQFLASVATETQARQVHAAGADIIDLKDPARGALGAVNITVAEQVVQALGSVATISATIGDLPLRVDEIEPAILAMSGAGVGIIKVGVFGEQISDQVLGLLGELADRKINIMLVFFAEFFHHNVHYRQIKQSGVKGVMLDTCEKGNGGLRDKLDDDVLAGFVSSAREAGLLCGLAGSLSHDDIADLLLLAPDYLGFRGALCKAYQRDQQLDMGEVSRIRGLIPERLHIDRAIHY